MSELERQVRQIKVLLFVYIALFVFSLWWTHRSLGPVFSALEDIQINGINFTSDAD